MTGSASSRLRTLLRDDASLCAITGLVALGAFSAGGAAVALLVAAVVGGLGLLQLRAAG